MRTTVLPDKTRVGMFIDVTRREEAEKALREVNIDLENRVEKRTAELKEINKKLRREIRERRKAEKELEHSREELRFLSEYLQRARDEERLSIAREVHDELGQLLSVMKIDTSFLGQNVPKRSGHIKKQIESFERRIDGAIQAVRDICSRLRPSVLTHFGLSAAIEWYLEDLGKHTGINCISQIDVDVPVEETELSLVLFRILQESMTNILRHAEASEVNVSLTVKDDDIVLKVRDNGRGITTDQMMKPQSFGIIGIRERVRFWGGASTFEGVPDKGTTVTISIPIKKTTPLSKSRAVLTEKKGAKPL
jgi:signal transduction histidine kinase